MQGLAKYICLIMLAIFVQNGFVIVRQEVLKKLLDWNTDASLQYDGASIKNVHDLAEMVSELFAY